jgi:hypothetical protein
MEQGNEKKALPKTGKRSFFGEIIESVAIAVILAVLSFFIFFQTNSFWRPVPATLL